MGKGIVYCHDCGRSLREEEFAKGKAHTVDDRPYCAVCRPLDPTPPTGAYKPVSPRKSSSHHPAVTPQTPRRGSPAAGRAAPGRGEGPARSSRTPLLVGSALAGAAVVILLVLLLSGGGAPAPSAEAAGTSAPPSDPADERLRDLEKLAANSPDPDAVLLRCDQLRASFLGTRHATRFRQIESRAIEMKAQKERERSGQLDRFLAEIGKIIQGDPEFRRKAEILDMYESARKTAGPRAREIEKLKGGYESAFEDAAGLAFEQARAEAAGLAAQEKFAEAAARLEGFPEPFLAGSQGKRLEGLRQEYQRKAEELGKSARVFFEGEDLKVLEKKGTVQSQDMRKFGTWSNGNQLWWRDARPGDVLRLEFASNVAGRRRLILALTKAPDYGIVRLSVNGAVIVESLDLFNNKKVIHTGEIPYEVDLQKGPNEIRVEIVGTNPKASPANYMFGLDYLRIE